MFADIDNDDVGNCVFGRGLGHSRIAGEGLAVRPRFMIPRDVSDAVCWPSGVSELGGRALLYGEGLSEVAE